MKIAIVGEAWGVEEARAQTPFIGTSGQELTRMLSDAGIHRADCFLTNVFNLHPKGNDLDELCGAKDTAIQGYPSLGKSRYVRSDFAGELLRLGQELVECRANVVIALGNTAMWALLGKTAISKYRGVTDVSTHLVPGLKVLPTYHPAAVTRDWSLRATTIIDLIKAKRESEFPELRRPHREVWIEPTLQDIEDFHAKYTRDFLSVDIETSGNQITCIGFAPSGEVGIVIPFYDSRRSGRSYWGTADDEHSAWRSVRSTLINPRIRKLFQNGLYDIAFLWRSVGIRVRGAEHDTMLLHHALQPEALKGLGYLGSIYTDERSWKGMRGKINTVKADD